ncbi:MAG: terminase [Pseudomonadota bacterium]
MVAKSQTANQLLADAVADFYADPLGFVLFAFPWGEKGSPLENYRGPRLWQWEFLEWLGEEIKTRGFDGVNAVQPMQRATSSGHGIGKSALVAMLIMFIMSTRPHAKGIVTANTSDQLRTKTWSELGKWHRMSVTQDWFAYNSGKGNLSLVSTMFPETWRCDAQTCREENSESFAGLHAVNSTPFYIFDEASAVPDKIYEVSDGGLTDGEPMRFLFGNPTRNTGRFFEAFNRQRHRWSNVQIDSRSVDGTNKQLLQDMVDDWGEDSDYVRVRVRGMFPSAGDLQFIPTADVEACIAKPQPDTVDWSAPVVLGVDVARFGDDKTVIYPRIGRDARSFPPKTYRKMDTMDTVHRVLEMVGEFKALNHEVDAIIVDGVGVGGGVVDRLRELGYTVHEINGGGKARSADTHVNMNAEMWSAMKAKIQDGLLLPDDRDLVADLTGREYGFTDKHQLKLEKKDDMKKRGLASPDIADALALTFAVPIHPDFRSQGIHQDEAVTEYDPYANM